MKIGDRIKARREFLKMTQEELALKMGYKSRSTINKIELGINDIPQSKISDFAKILKTTPAYLMGLVEEENIKLTRDNLTKHNIAFFKDKDISDEDKKKMIELMQEFYYKQKYGSLSIFHYNKD
mgnify:CR=1 FL=1